jgi:hypothetical protein
MVLRTHLSESNRITSYGLKEKAYYIIVPSGRCFVECDLAAAVPGERVGAILQ